MELNILGYKCKKCGHIMYPYRTVCDKCKDNDFDGFEIVPLPKSGKLLTFTRLYTLPADFETMSIALGIVELANGNRITGQLDIKEPKIGMKVLGRIGVVRKDAYNKQLGMIFSEG